MLYANAVKKLQKTYTADKVQDDDRIVRADAGTHWISVYRNGGGSDQVAVIHVGRKGDEADSHSDYFPGCYPKTLAQAIAFAR